MKLFYLTGAEDDPRFSPSCWRIKMALKHKGWLSIWWRRGESNPRPKVFHQL